MKGMNKMKLKFDSNLDYQNEAINAVVDLFEGQNSLLSYFTVTGQLPLDKTTSGVGNKIDISNDDILTNLKKIQTNNRLAPNESLKSLDFNIEMETGTGKTYVYLKTIFELNKKYNFKKFIVVVPSIAIKEGVYKSVEITKEHFMGLYENIPYDAFIYDSSKLELVRNFAVSSEIQIMIINIDAFNRSFTKNALDENQKMSNANIIHRENDKLNGWKPIELIQETNPIVIIDEPQSVVGTSKSKDAIASLNPLCTLQYSATHKEIHNLIYKLDAVDAYEMDLVKQIEVASFESLDYHNKAYLKLVSVDNMKSPITALIEVDSYSNGNIKRKTVTVRKGDDLSSKKLGNRDIYGGYVVNEIYCEEDNEYLSFTNRDDILRINKKVGDFDDAILKRERIRKTIEEHLDKEVRLTIKGIKVLSLFFIDKVSNYRIYDEDGKPQKGLYAQIFEEEYNKLIKLPKYNTLTKDIDYNIPVEKIHNGYFSIDKTGKNKNRFKDTKGNTKLDDDTYNIIMKDKEKLLSFKSPLRFIFSHSALREGWDNPNVFQICTLNETKSTMKKRQEIGRGLRLCVNQEGDRLHDKSINTLTVMANESYEEFAKELQLEMEQDQGIKFGIIEPNTFAYIKMENKKGKTEPIGEQGSMQIFNFFKEKKYINGEGKVLDELKLAVEEGNVEVPERFEKIKERIIETAKKRTKVHEIKDKRRKIKLKTNKRVFLGDDFKEFWEKIKHKTTYSVDFSTEKLINNCSKALNEELDIATPKLLYTKAGVTIDASGIEVNENGTAIVHSQEHEIILPDIITFLQNETYLTRKTIAKVLIKSETLDQFKKNPQEYMEESLRIISQEMNHMLIDGIKYTKIGKYYAQELFETEEIHGYLSDKLVKSENSVYDYVVCDSEPEKKFAEGLENSTEVVLYTKLPRWFKIKTPIGNYNPDWAVLLDVNNEKKMYFIVETKGTKNTKELRTNEMDKIKCGKEHFNALDTDIEFKVENSFKKFISTI
jgi:type III restriction enzyme